MEKALTVHTFAKRVKCGLALIWFFTTLLAIYLIGNRFPGNHGRGYGLILGVYCTGLLLSIFYVIRLRRVLLAIAFVYLVSVAVVLYLNEINVFITYSQWVERGMPRWGLNEKS